MTRMSSFRPSVSPPVAQTAARPGKVSCVNTFAGRGRGRDAARRAGWTDPAEMKMNFSGEWARLMRAKFASPSACAVMFDVSLQTAMNWFDGGICRAAGDKVALAALWWPEEFRAAMRRAA